MRLNNQLQFWKVMLLLSVFIVSIGAADYPQFSLNKLLQQQSKKSTTPSALKRRLNSENSEDNLRTEAFGNANGNTVLELLVQDGDQSVLLTAQTASAAKEIAVLKITDPDAVVIYQADINQETPTISGGLTNDIIGGVGELGFFLPLFPNGVGQLKVGTYHIELAAEDDVSIQNIQAVFKTGSSAQQAINLNFWVADRDPRLTRPEYLDDFFRDLKVELNNLLEPQNMRIGKLKFKNANFADREQFAVANADNLQPLCNKVAQSMGVSQAMNIALVETIVSADLTDIAGVSPLSPGTFKDANAHLNCIAISQRAYSNAIQLHAGNVIHEIGHYLSLPHTTEQDGATHDYFADTPECNAATYDGRTNLGVVGVLDAEVSDHECGFEGGADNFLFYAGHADFAPFNISTEQAFVLQRSPFFYSIAPSFSIQSGITGSWFNPQQSGHGFLVEVLADQQMFAAWFVFDAAGNREWITAIGDYQGNTATLQAFRSTGGFFPPAFDTEQVTQESWGEIRLEFTDCQHAKASWTPVVSGFEDGSLDLQRLTSIAGLACQ